MGLNVPSQKNKIKKKTLKKLIMTHLLLIHRLCCEQFHVGTTFCLPNYTHQPYHCTEGSMCLLIDERGAHVCISAGCEH